MPSGYDVIVVGAGSAGCVVAARLAADPGRRVLLLEAGPDHSGAISGALRDGWGLPRGADWPDDWGYASEPDAAGTSAPLRRGKLLGGTSWLTRFALRGSPTDFDAWAARGLDGWSFEDVLPSFRRVEADLEFGDQAWHGGAGPIPITRYPSEARQPVHTAIVAALVASGFDPVDDVNRPGALGVGPMPMSSAGGRRVSAADAFLPLGGRPANLTIRPDATISSVVVAGARATGVRLVDGTDVDGDQVVVCAGAYGSPAILLRSGIGPADDLRALRVPVVLDLPGVGKGLADHPAVELELGWSGAAAPAPLLHSVASWHSSGGAASPDMLFWIADPQGDPPSMSIECVLMRPSSRGSVRLRSNDPADPPRISLPTRGPADVQRLGEGYRRALEVAVRPDVRALCATELQPAPASRSELDAFVVENVYSIPHVVGTCAMGIAPSNGAVVDGDGRVHGIGGFRVVDASIIPEPPSGFPNLITTMVASKLADRIADVS